MPEQHRKKYTSSQSPKQTIIIHVPHHRTRCTPLSADNMLGQLEPSRTTMPLPPIGTASALDTAQPITLSEAKGQVTTLGRAGPLRATPRHGYAWVDQYLGLGQHADSQGSSFSQNDTRPLPLSSSEMRPGWIETASSVQPSPPHLMFPRPIPNLHVAQGRKPNMPHIIPETAACTSHLKNRGSQARISPSQNSDPSGFTEGAPLSVSLICPPNPLINARRSLVNIL